MTLQDDFDISTSTEPATFLRTTERPGAALWLSPGRNHKGARTVMTDPKADAISHRDAELLDLALQHAEAEEQDRIESDALDKVWSLVHESTPDLPPALLVEGSDWFYGHGQVGKPFRGDQVERWRAALADAAYRINLSAGLADRFASRGNEVVTAWDAYQKDVEACAQLFGLPEAEEAARSRLKAIVELEKRIASTPATTPDGWRAKASIAKKLSDRGDDLDIVLQSLLNDLAPAKAAA